jgi:acyl-CoA synthetase (AMP-forming)/AMP-acid ligase II
VVPGSIGICIPNTECRIVDYETGKDLGTGMQGELWIRGPQVMKGYLNNEEATNQTIDPEGWLKTGDIAEVDEDGYFKIVDRVKELIKYKGFQVAPAELEALLLTHPSIADCAVVPAEDPEAGEIPVGFVVYKENMVENPETIMEFIAQKVSPQKKIRRIIQIEQIPKSPSGKILRRHLRDQIA